MSLEKLPSSMLDALALVSRIQQPITLLSRHSIRFEAEKGQIAGYNLQLTEQGRTLAHAWGRELSQQLGFSIKQCITSPIPRCVDTAGLMLAGANHPHIEIERHHLLVEPGSLVQDIAKVAPYFRKQGALQLINAFLAAELVGLKQPRDGAIDILQMLFQRQPKKGLQLAISHDTILAALIAVIQQKNKITSEDWPEMMEGIFLWFSNDNDFDQAELHWIWRGQQQSLPIQHLKSNMQPLD